MPEPFPLQVGQVTLEIPPASSSTNTYPLPLQIGHLVIVSLTNIMYSLDLNLIDWYLIKFFFINIIFILHGCLRFDCAIDDQIMLDW